LTEDFLVAALRRFRETDNSQKVNFSIKYFPYQLYPGASREGEDKYEWYKKSRYGDSEEKMEMYTTLMTAYGVTAGIDFKFGGSVANTLDAHRLVQHYQEEKGPETADKLINGMHRCQQYHDPMLTSAQRCTRNISSMNGIRQRTRRF
jgi:predicted DsbA family dithiol-disulfide isomerase